MFSLIDDIFECCAPCRCCKLEEKKGRISLSPNHDEAVCIFKITDELINNLQIHGKRADDCLILYTSGSFKFRPVLFLVELKASSQEREINKAKRQLRNLIRAFRKRYGDVWNKFVNSGLISAIIVHDSPIYTDGRSDKDLEHIRLFFLRTPASPTRLRKKVINEILKEVNR